MPTYEYVCLECGQHVEVYQSFSEEPLSMCPNCGGPLRKVFHPAGILFKGSGFYKTDSRSKTKSSSGDGAGASKSSGSTKKSGEGSSGSGGSGGSKQPASTGGSKGSD